MDESIEPTTAGDEPPRTTTEMAEWRALARAQLRAKPFVPGLDALRRTLLPMPIEGYKVARLLATIALSEVLELQLETEIVDQFRRLAFRLMQSYLGQERSHLERSGEGHSKTSLLWRGWTPALIAELLGDPDLPKVRGRAHATFSHARVEQAEQDPRLKDKVAKRLAAWATERAALAAEAEATRKPAQARPPLRWHLPDEPTVTDVVEALAEIAPQHLRISLSLVEAVPPLYAAGRLRALARNASTTVTWRGGHWDRTGTLEGLSKARRSSWSNDYRFDDDLVQDLLPQLLLVHPELSAYADICSWRPQPTLEAALLAHYADRTAATTDHAPTGIQTLESTP